jgi:Ser-tRNA(Ala) deacylase AlaX
MSEIACTATMSEEVIKLNIDGNVISIPLDGDIEFTDLVKLLTNLIEHKNRIQITWTESEQATDKENVAKMVIDEIIDSFNQIIEEEFDERDEDDADNPV